jgi:hyperpolarization activated cyclic nucleotide-gated potassium channel 2
MESIAAERLNKIGKNPSIVSQREDLQTDLKAVSELLTLSAQSPSDDSESEISLFKFKHPLPRPKSESCFPRFNANGTEINILRPDSSVLQRSETFFQSIVGSIKPESFHT